MQIKHILKEQTPVTPAPVAAQSGVAAPAASAVKNVQQAAGQVKDNKLRAC
jgi:hypothetical protein